MNVDMNELVNQTVRTQLAAKVLESITNEDRDKILQRSISDAVKDYSFRNAVEEAVAEAACKSAKIWLETSEGKDWMDDCVASTFGELGPLLKEAMFRAMVEAISGKSDLTMEMKIALDPVSLREATSQAIMGTLTPEVRARIIQQAISSLLNPNTDSWSSSKESPIQQAFNDAVFMAAREVAREHVKGDQAIMGQIRILLQKTADKAMAMDANKLAEKMADAFVNSMRRE